MKPSDEQRRTERTLEMVIQSAKTSLASGQVPPKEALKVILWRSETELSRLRNERG